MTNVIVGAATWLLRVNDRDAVVFNRLCTARDFGLSKASEAKARPKATTKARIELSLDTQKHSPLLDQPFLSDWKKGNVHSRSNTYGVIA